MTYITGYKSRITSRIEQSDGTSATFTLADNPGADGAYTLKLQNELNSIREWMTVTTVGTTATIVLRGLSTSSARTEVAANKLQWREGSVVKIVADKDDLIDKDDNNLAFGDSLAADKTITFRTDATIDPTVYTDDSNDSQLKGNRGDDEGAAGDYSIGHTILTTTERDNLTSPLNGMSIYNSTTGVMNFREAGAWVANAAGGSIPTAATTTKGGVEIGTSAETIAGTDTGGTSASLLALPSDIAKNTQSGTFVYAADGEASDTYVITMTPTLTAYTTGMVVNFKANTANTGACTLNIDTLGAKSIKKTHDADPADNDIESGQIVTVVYDGTNFQMQSQVANAPVIAADITIKVGQSGPNITGDGATNIAHGLGRVPSITTLQICTTTSIADIGDYTMATIYYDGTTQNNIAYRGTGTTSATVSAFTGTLDINVNAVKQFDLAITVTSTNIVVTAANHAASEQLGIIWRVE